MGSPIWCEPKSEPTFIPATPPPGTEPMVRLPTLSRPQFPGKFGELQLPHSVAERAVSVNNRNKHLLNTYSGHAFC